MKIWGKRTKRRNAFAEIKIYQTKYHFLKVTVEDKVTSKWGYFGHTHKLSLKPKLNYSWVTLATKQIKKIVLIYVKLLEILLINMYSIV